MSRPHNERTSRSGHAGEVSGRIDANQLALGRSSYAVDLSKQQLKQAESVLSKMDAGAAERVALLGLLLAELDATPFEAVSTLLGVKATRLEKMMHGTEKVPLSVVDRWEVLAELLANLHTVIQASATWRWLNAEIDALGGRTPLETIRSGEVSAVLDVTRAYREPSFL